MRRFIVSLLTVLIGLVALAPSAAAHSGKQSYLYLSFFGDDVVGRVEIPVTDLGAVLGVEIPQGDAAAPIVEAQLPEIHAYLLRTVALGDDDGNWPLTFEGWSLLHTSQGTYAQFPFDAAADVDGPPRELVATFEAVIESDPEKDALLLIENDFGTATFENEGEHLLGFSTGLTEQRVVLENESIWSSVTAVAGLGVDRVRAGIDVMLVGVAVVAMIVLSSTDRRSSALGAFLVGQGVALWLVGLAAPGSDRVADGLAAVAVVAAGVACALATRLTASLVPVIAGALGAVQGVVLGARFAADRLDATSPFASALGYHLGVLGATLLVIVFTAAPLVIVRPTRWRPAAAVVVGAIVAVYGVAWLGEWLADADWAIERFANPWRVWPRNLVGVVALVGAALLLRRGRPAEGEDRSS